MSQLAIIKLLYYIRSILNKWHRIELYHCFGRMGYSCVHNQWCLLFKFMKVSSMLLQQQLSNMLCDDERACCHYSNLMEKRWKVFLFHPLYILCKYWIDTNYDVKRCFYGLNIYILYICRSVHQIYSDFKHRIWISECCYDIYGGIPW